MYDTNTASSHWPRQSVPCHTLFTANVRKCVWNVSIVVSVRQTEWVEYGWIVSETSLVWCLQRFEHSTGYHKKISTYVSFPEELDMTPFMSNTRHHGATEDQLTQDSMLSLSSENKWVMLLYCDWAEQTVNDYDVTSNPLMPTVDKWLQL